MEINYGPFETVLDLPAGYDLTRAKALYVNGFLRIDVPPVSQPHTKTTKVPISEGARHARYL
jgi:HSP20 family molecular chaperone IbpA